MNIDWIILILIERQIGDSLPGKKKCPQITKINAQLH